MALMTLKSRSTTAKPIRPKLPPVHPGEVLKETIDDMGISMNRLAHALHVPANRISGIVAGHRSITGETALRLGRYFGTTPDYWIGMQTQFDLETARDEWEADIQAEVEPRQTAA
jgi:addiction module HigA family antidote